MQKLTEVLGEYGVYIWPAFAVTGFCMAWLAVASVRAYGRVIQAAAALKAADEA